MSRATRLLDLMQLLRRHRQPVAGAALAEKLGVSLRSLYRDIATLQAQGAQIEGEAGLGYVLKPGFVLPPLMFNADEIEALVLGARYVVGRADADLAEAARAAMAKIAAVLPPEARHDMDGSSLLVGSGEAIAALDQNLARLRVAMRQERKVALQYRDLRGQASGRVVWPVALGFFDGCKVLVAWCELRQALRHFRVDRIEHLGVQAESYPTRRQALLKQWREQQKIAADKN